jgi:hypothetical protein
LVNLRPCHRPLEATLVAMHRHRLSRAPLDHARVVFPRQRRAHRTQADKHPKAIAAKIGRSSPVRFAFTAI